MNGENYTFDPGKAKSKPASVYLMTWGVKEGSVLHNGDLTVSYEMAQQGNGGSINWNTDKYGLAYFNMALVVSVKNNTDQTLYLDLGNTFIVRGGDAAPYYVPTATSSTSTTSGGVGVNMGAVAGALGVGGAVGTLASGVNVGGGKSSGSTNIVYSQRVVAIPPRSSKRLDPKFLSEQENGDDAFMGFKCRPGCGKEAKGYMLRIQTFGLPEVCLGQRYVPDAGDDRLNCAFHVSYSSDESCQTLRSLRTDFFIKEIIGTGTYSWGSVTETNYNKVGLVGKPGKTLSFIVCREKQ